MKKNGKKKKMHPAVKFALIVFSIVFSFILLAGIGVMAYISNSVVKEVSRPPDIYADDTEKPKKKTFGGQIEKLFERVPERTNFLLCGVDDEGGGMRTDTMMIGCFNSSTNNVSLISIPRDIMVSMPRDLVRELNAEGIYPPDYMKFNEVHAWAGQEYGLYALMKQIEHEFGIELDYYVKIDTDGFVEVVDALGGVDMTLTRNYNYYDPDQDLRINLKAGPQHLDGKAAEGLVRFRSDYGRGDLQRIEVQQEFMRELLKQSLQREKVMNNLQPLLSTVIKNVTTDMELSQASKYLRFIPALSPANFDTYTLPTGEGYRDDNGIAFISLDEDGAAELIEKVFFGYPDEPPKDSKEFRISVLNGSGVSGLAKQTSEMLEGKGYNVTYIGDYNGTRTAEDRVFVKEYGYGEDLKKMFPGSEVVVDKNSISEGADITIVLGTDNKDGEE